MGACCAGICGGTAASKGKEESTYRRLLGEKLPIAVKRPGAIEDQVTDTEASLCGDLGLSPAPPEAPRPAALVSADFRNNSARLLVLLPGGTAEPGTWDGGIPGDCGAAAPLVAWAQANKYAVALFLGPQLASSPAEALDSVLVGSPARMVTVLAARGALPLLLAALAPQHPVLYGRIRVVVPWGDSDSAASLAAATANAGGAGDKAPESALNAAGHILRFLHVLPEAWAEKGAWEFRKAIFQYLAETEDKWQENENRKFASISGLKENDIPGFRRLGVDARLERLDRDRDNDELSRLCKTYAGDEDEPGVD